MHFFIILLNLLTFVRHHSCFECSKQTNADGAFTCHYGNLTEVPRNIRSGTTSLDLSNNDIEILHEDVFKQLIRLRRLILDNNKLWKITELAFSDLRDLEELSLMNNNLVIQRNGLSSAAFTYLPRLRSLYLSQNPLGRLPDQFFSKLRSLKVLHIDDAVQGLRIEKGALDGLNNLRELSLANNRLTTLSSDLEAGLNRMNLKHLYLDGNAWNCNCHLRWLRRWFETRNKTREIITARMTNYQRISPKCWKPEQLDGKYMFDLQITNFQCAPTISTASKSIHVSEYENVTFICSFYSEPKSYVKWFKDGTLIQNHWKRITRKTDSGYRFRANLTIVDITKEDEGVYKCETGNFRGFVSANFTLIVRVEPSKGLKLDKVVVLVGIGASGLVVLLAAVGIIVYCFYGQYPMKTRPTVQTNNNNKHGLQLIPCNANGDPRTFHSQTEEALNAHRDATFATQMLDNHAKKHLLISTGPGSVVNSIGSNSLLRQEAVPLTTQLSIDRCQSPAPEQHTHNDDCPVHGTNRMNYSPCPVHGPPNRTETPVLGGTSGYGTLPYSSNSHQHSSQCPVHGGSSSPPSSINRSLQRNHSHSPQTHHSILRPRSPTSGDAAFMRTSQVDDCLTPSSPCPPVPLHAPSHYSLGNSNHGAGLVLPSATVADSDGLLRFYEGSGSKGIDDDVSTAV